MRHFHWDFAQWKVLAVGVCRALAAATYGTAANAQGFETTLSAADRSGTPDGQERASWMEATGTASATSSGDQHEVTLDATGLVPGGLYTIWWVNAGALGMDMGPAGGTPANQFRAADDGSAEATISVPADNDYQMLVVAFHSDDRTHGETPGEMGKVTFEHLMGPWPGPAGKMADM